MQALSRRFLTLAPPIVLALLLLTACGSSSSSPNQGSAITSPVPSVQPTATPSPTPAAHFTPGQSIQVGNTWQVTISHPKKVTPGQYDYIKSSGDVILLIPVSLKNISPQEQSLFAYAQFTLRDSTGAAATPTYIQSARQAPNGKVEAGSPLSGDLVYEIPPGKHTFTLAFEASFTAPGQTIWDITV